MAAMDADILDTLLPPPEEEGKLRVRVVSTIRRERPSTRWLILTVYSSRGKNPDPPLSRLTMRTIRSEMRCDT